MSLFSVVMTFMLVKMVNAITRPVIQLYELIKHIVEKGKGTKLTLTYKPTNFELNKLHLTFNYLAKTMMIAKIASQDEEDKTRALLHYFEALLTFKEFKNWAA
jgi:signal transduction histidine kinase